MPPVGQCFFLNLLSAKDLIMPRIYLQCQNCHRLFPSGFSVGASTKFNGCISQCPFCKSLESIPDGEFKTNVSGLITILQKSSNPQAEIEEVLSELNKIKTNRDVENIKKQYRFKKFKDWLPDTPEKIAAYIYILYFLFNQLQEGQTLTKIETNNIFINKYNISVTENHKKIGLNFK